MLVGIDIERLVGKRQPDAPSSPSYTLTNLERLAKQWAIEQKILASDRWNVSCLLAWLRRKEREANERST